MKKPKEKAQEILNEMHKCGKDMMVPRHVTTACAKVALDHIQKQSYTASQYNYWIKVKNEIEKL